MNLTVRPALESDLAAITEIYNEAILTTTATFDTEPKSIENRRDWFHSHDERHPILVAEADGRVVGWISLTRWSDRPAYEQTAESSIYVRSEYRGQGVGRRLKTAMIDQARRLGFHVLIARVAEESIASLQLNLSLGFQMVGTLREVGTKFGKRLSVHILQLMLTQDFARSRNGDVAIEASSPTAATGLSFRFAELDDCSLLARLNRQLIQDEGHSNPMSESELNERMRGWLQGEYQAILFHSLSGVVAYALYRDGPDDIHLRQFFVCREWRRKGIGRQAIDILRSKIWPDHKRLTVETLCHNSAALSFWHSVGFKDYSLTLDCTSATNRTPGG